LKILSLLLFLTTLAFSKVYYAKVEPYELRDIASNVSGEVIFTDEDMLGKVLKSKPFIKIDDELNRDELVSVKEKLSYLQNTLTTNEKILVNLKDALTRKKENFKRIESLSIKSKVEKDREFYDVVGSENSYLATLKEINSLKTNISDLRLREKQLEKSIADKSIAAKGFVLYALKVKEGNVVNMGTPLATVADVRKAVATIYIDADELVNIGAKHIYIDGQKTSYKLTRVLKIADTKNISRYRAQIIMKRPEIFSKLVKIELKEDTNEKK